MRRYIRAVIVCLVTVIVMMSGRFAPTLWDPGTVKSLSGIFAITSMLLFAFFRQLNSVTGVGVLNTREMERYTLQRQSIRRRFWFAFAATATCCGILWLMSGYATLLHTYWAYTAIVGFLFAMNVGYAVSIGRWLDDLASFNDKLRTREQKLKEEEAVLKRLSEAKKAGSG